MLCGPDALNRKLASASSFPVPLVAARDITSAKISNDPFPLLAEDAARSFAAMASNPTRNVCVVRQLPAC